MKQKNQPKILNAWASYDWANSVYNLTITTAIFPIYYLAVTNSAFNGEVVNLFGWEVKNDVIYSYAVSFSFFIIVFLSPILSGIADYGGKKKIFMQLFTYTGSIACVGLFFFDGTNLAYGLFCFIMASVGYAGALVFYNAFLPEIATSDRFDEISARGFSLGYIGSVILLIISLINIQKVEWFFDLDTYAQELIAVDASLSGIDAEKMAVVYYTTFATRLSFLLVGVWWVVFAQIAFYFLKDEPTGNKITASTLGKGFQELKKVWERIKHMGTTKGFLLSFFFYSMGVQTVMVLAPLFGEKEIHLETANMIMTVLILQIIAVPGAYIFAQVSKYKGNKTAILIMLFMWIMICISAYFTRTDMQFYVLAAGVGLIMGGIQSLSRSTYSKLIPEDSHDTASFFSFYDVTEKVAIVIGTFSFGLITEMTSMRDSAIALSVYFLIGIVVLMRTKMDLKSQEVIEE